MNLLATVSGTYQHIYELPNTSLSKPALVFNQIASDKYVPHKNVVIVTEFLILYAH